MGDYYGPSLKQLAEQRDREWAKLSDMNPDRDELQMLRRHLEWRRLPAEAKLNTEWLPGMGRRRGDR
jgi:hypothetical protein